MGTMVDSAQIDETTLCSSHGRWGLYGGRAATSLEGRGRKRGWRVDKTTRRHRRYQLQVEVEKGVGGVRPVDSIQTPGWDYPCATGAVILSLLVTYILAGLLSEQA